MPASPAVVPAPAPAPATGATTKDLLAPTNAGHSGADDGDSATNAAATSADDFSPDPTPRNDGGRTGRLEVRATAHTVDGPALDGDDTAVDDDDADDSASALARKRGRAASDADSVFAVAAGLPSFSRAASSALGGRASSHGGSHHGGHGGGHGGHGHGGGHGGPPAGVDRQSSVVSFSVSDAGASRSVSRAGSIMSSIPPLSGGGPSVAAGGGLRPRMSTFSVMSQPLSGGAPESFRPDFGATDDAAVAEADALKHAHAHAAPGAVVNERDDDDAAADDADESKRPDDAAAVAAAAAATEPRSGESDSAAAAMAASVAAVASIAHTTVIDVKRADGPAADSSEAAGPTRTSPKHVQHTARTARTVAFDAEIDAGRAAAAAAVLQVDALNALPNDSFLAPEPGRFPRLDRARTLAATLRATKVDPTSKLVLPAFDAVSFGKLREALGTTQHARHLLGITFFPAEYKRLYELLHKLPRKRTDSECVELFRFVCHTPLFCDVPQSVGVRVCRDMTTVAYKKKDVLYRQGDYADALYLLMTGCVCDERTHPQTGFWHIVATTNPPNTVGEASLRDAADLGRAYRTTSATCLDDTEVLVLYAESYDVLKRFRDAQHQAIAHFFTTRVPCPVFGNGGAHHNGPNNAGSMPRDKLMALCRLVTTVQHPRNTLVAIEGACPKQVWFLKRGAARILKAVPPPQRKPSSNPKAAAAAAASATAGAPAGAGHDRTDSTATDASNAAAEEQARLGAALAEHGSSGQAPSQAALPASAEPELPPDPTEAADFHGTLKSAAERAEREQQQRARQDADTNDNAAAPQTPKGDADKPKPQSTPTTTRVQKQQPAADADIPFADLGPLAVGQFFGRLSIRDQYQLPFSVLTTEESEFYVLATHDLVDGVEYAAHRTQARAEASTAQMLVLPTVLAAAVAAAHVPANAASGSSSSEAEAEASASLAAQRPQHLQVPGAGDGGALITAGDSSSGSGSGAGPNSNGSAIAVSTSSASGTGTASTAPPPAPVPPPLNPNLSQHHHNDVLDAMQAYLDEMVLRDPRDLQAAVDAHARWRQHKQAVLDRALVARNAKALLRVYNSAILSDRGLYFPRIPSESAVPKHLEERARGAFALRFAAAQDVTPVRGRAPGSVLWVSGGAGGAAPNQLQTKSDTDPLKLILKIASDTKAVEHGVADWELARKRKHRLAAEAVVHLAKSGPVRGLPPPTAASPSPTKQGGASAGTTSPGKSKSKAKPAANAYPGSEDIEELSPRFQPRARATAGDGNGGNNSSNNWDTEDRDVASDLDDDSDASARDEDARDVDLDNMDDVRWLQKAEQDRRDKRRVRRERAALQRVLEQREAERVAAMQATAEAKLKALESHAQQKLLAQQEARVAQHRRKLQHLRGQLPGAGPQAGAGASGATLIAANATPKLYTSLAEYQALGQANAAPHHFLLNAGASPLRSPTPRATANHAVVRMSPPSAAAAAARPLASSASAPVLLPPPPRSPGVPLRVAAANQHAAALVAAAAPPGAFTPTSPMTAAFGSLSLNPLLAVNAVRHDNNNNTTTSARHHAPAQLQPVVVLGSSSPSRGAQPTGATAPSPKLAGAFPTAPARPGQSPVRPKAKPTPTPKQQQHKYPTAGSTTAPRSVHRFHEYLSHASHLNASSSTAEDLPPSAGVESGGFGGDEPDDTGMGDTAAAAHGPLRRVHHVAHNAHHAPAHGHLMPSASKHVRTLLSTPAALRAFLGSLPAAAPTATTPLPVTAPPAEGAAAQHKRKASNKSVSLAAAAAAALAAAASPLPPTQESGGASVASLAPPGLSVTPEPGAARPVAVASALLSSSASTPALVSRPKSEERKRPAARVVSIPDPPALAVPSGMLSPDSDIDSSRYAALYARPAVPEASPRAPLPTPAPSAQLNTAYLEPLHHLAKRKTPKAQPKASKATSKSPRQRAAANSSSSAKAAAARS